jgi:hypothetical protein
MVEKRKEARQQKRLVGLVCLLIIVYYVTIYMYIYRERKRKRERGEDREAPEAPGRL